MIAQFPRWRFRLKVRDAMADSSNEVLMVEIDELSCFRV